MKPVTIFAATAFMLFAIATTTFAQTDTTQEKFDGGIPVGVLKQGDVNSLDSIVSKPPGTNVHKKNGSVNDSLYNERENIGNDNQNSADTTRRKKNGKSGGVLVK